MVRSEKFHGGAGLRRCNRSRGFFEIFARHRKIHDNYTFLQGLNCKKLQHSAMVTGGHCSPNFRQFRAWEVARSGANERGRWGDSIPYLTYHGDASWWSNFVKEEVTAGLLQAVSLLFVVAVLQGTKAVQEEVQGVAQEEEQGQGA
jgi:hypothetical protein